MTAPKRALLGFVAAVVSVLTFHQGMWAVLHMVGIMPLRPTPPTPCRRSGCRSSQASASGVVYTVLSLIWPCRGYHMGQRGYSGLVSACLQQPSAGSSWHP